MNFRCPQPQRQGKSYIANGKRPALTYEQSCEIKRRADSGTTHVVLAKEYGVRPDTIRAAITRAEFGKAVASA